MKILTYIPLFRFYQLHFSHQFYHQLHFIHHLYVKYFFYRSYTCVTLTCVYSFIFISNGFACQWNGVLLVIY